MVASLTLQIEAGAQAVQLFDSWAGLLSPEDWEEFAAPYAARALEAVGQSVPRIYFPPGGSTFLPRIERMRIPAEVIGIDWRIPLDEARRALGDRYAVQGNLDPGVLLGNEEAIRRKTGAILARARGARGHVMNLGHGILPETPVANAQAFVDATHEGRIPAEIERSVT